MGGKLGMGNIATANAFSCRMRVTEGRRPCARPCFSARRRGQVVVAGRLCTMRRVRAQHRGVGAVSSLLERAAVVHEQASRRGRIARRAAVGVPPVYISVRFLV